MREDYQAAFGREADTSGLKGWINLLKNGATPAQLAQDLTTTPEFQALHALQTNAQYVESLYEAVWDVKQTKGAPKAGSARFSPEPHDTRRTS